MTATVSLRDVMMSYQIGRESVPVLQDFNLEIAAGEFAAIMGPSGSGKSTILNLIAGLDRPTRGEIEVAGQAVSRLSISQAAAWRSRHIGFVFQFYNLMPLLTAEQNVELPLLLAPVSAEQRRQRTRAALGLVGIADRARHRPSELSGGQQQRVAIARAIVTDPSLILCDEPTGDLDRSNAGEILELLAALNREQSKTIVMVTHDAQAASYASRVIALDKGVLMREQNAA